MTDETATSRADSTSMTAHLLRLPRLLELTGLGRSTLYKMIAEHAFPEPVKLSGAPWRGGMTTCACGPAAGFQRRVSPSHIAGQAEPAPKGYPSCRR